MTCVHFLPTEPAGKTRAQFISIHSHAPQASETVQEVEWAALGRVSLVVWTQLCSPQHFTQSILDGTSHNSGEEDCLPRR